jgi:hypothetical protein
MPDQTNILFTSKGACTHDPHDRGLNRLSHIYPEGLPWILG